MQTEAQNNHPPGQDAGGEQALKATPTTKGKFRKRGSIVSLIARFLLALLFLGGIYTSLLPWGQATLRATFILPSLLTASEPLPLALAGEPITHAQKVLPASHGRLYLDIFTPDAVPLIHGERQGVLLLPGVGDQRQVPQLINLEQTLARSGIVVVAMTTSTLLQDDVSIEDSADVVQAYHYLQALPTLQGQRTGMIAFSAGVPLVTHAAADSHIRDQVAYVTVFGGYYNAETLLETFGRRTVSYDGKTESWQPTTYALQVLANVTTEQLPTYEQELIRQAFSPYGPPLSPGEQDQLSPEGRAAYQLLSGTAPNRVAQNMAALTPAMHTQLQGLSTSQVIGEIHAPVYLLHDRNDAFLPFTETRTFDRDLTRLHHSHNYVEFHIFDHVEVRSNLNFFQTIGDGSKLFNLINQVFQAG